MSSLESLNYYDRLEVSKKASLEMIKLSYRNLSKRFHPDLNQEPDAEQKYLLIQEAYETLSDDQKRKSYDQTISSDDFWSSVEEMPNDLDQWDFPEESQPTKKRKWSVPSFYLDWSWDWYDVVGAIWWLICLPFRLVVWIAIGIYLLFQFILGLAALALMLFIAVPIIIYVFWFCVHSVFPNIM